MRAMMHLETNYQDFRSFLGIFVRNEEIELQVEWIRLLDEVYRTSERTACACLQRPPAESRRLSANPWKPYRETKIPEEISSLTVNAAYLHHPVWGHAASYLRRSLCASQTARLFRFNEHKKWKARCP